MPFISHQIHNSDQLKKQIVSIYKAREFLKQKSPYFLIIIVYHMRPLACHNLTKIQK